MSIRLLAVLCLSLAAPAAAQVAPAPPPAAPAPRHQAEQNVFNLPTTQPMRLHGHHFRLTHRFARNLTNGSFSLLASDLFGLDNGAVIGFDYRFAPLTNVQVGVYRSLLLKTIQVSGRWDAVQQGERVPAALSIVASVEGTNNLRDNHAPALGVVASHTIGTRVMLYATPMIVWNTLLPGGVDNHSDIAFVGVGGRARVLTSTFLVLEYAPRAAGDTPEGRGVWGVGVEKHTAGHIFQINLSNSFGTTYGQTALGGERGNVYLGFNLSRRW